MDSKPSDGLKKFKNSSLDPTVQIDTVLLSKIDSEDVTYQITTRSALEDLLPTIQSFGLLHLPVLIERACGYSIVCGFRRIAACRKLGWETITAKIYRAGTNPFKVARQSIADNILQRPLNLVETSRAMNLLADTSPDQEQLRNAALALGLSVSSAAFAKVKKICRLPFPIQDGILTGTINLAMALELARLDAEDSTALVGLFSQLKVGLNKQRELLMLLTEIGKREDAAIRQLIAEQTMQDILQDSELDRAIQRQKIRAHLRQRRYPAIVKAEMDYFKCVGQLKLGKHIQMIPPRDFEDTAYTLTLNFKNRQDLRDLKDKIEEMLENPALVKILKR